MEVSSYQSREGSECRTDWRDPVPGLQVDYLTQPVILKKDLNSQSYERKVFVKHYRHLVQPIAQKHYL